MKIPLQKSNSARVFFCKIIHFFMKCTFSILCENFFYFVRKATIIEEHNLAKNNGVCVEVKGLPDMYGAKLRVDYASGERIYTSNNQDNFLSVNVIKAMLRLFRTQLS